MTSQQQFKDRFLSRFAAQSPGQELFVSTGQLAMENGIAEPFIRELLIRWAGERLISMESWDGSRSKPWDEWPTPDSFFFNPLDSNQIRLKLLAAGSEHVELANKNKIGFTA